MKKILNTPNLKKLFSRPTLHQGNVPDANILGGCLIDRRDVNTEKLLENERNGHIPFVS